MIRFDATAQAVLIQVLFFVLSIGGAWVVLVILKGTASIRHKGAQFGGAAAMFVAMFFLLNKYVPEMRDGIISEARATQVQQIQTRNDKGDIQTLDLSISPERQKISGRDIKELDKNKYFVDEQLGVAVLRPQVGNWLLGAVQSFDKIGLADIPFVDLGLGIMRSVGGEAKDRSTFAIREDKIRKISIKRDSEIGGVRVGINPFSDESFVRKTIETQLESAAKMGATPIDLTDADTKKQMIDFMADAAAAQLKSGFEKYIDKVLPANKEIRNGVYVTVLELGSLPSDPLLGSLQKGMSTLDRAVQSIALKGFFAGGGRNIKIDQATGVASFDGSSRLKSIEIDGSVTDVTLNDIGFIVVGNDRIIFVQLISLDIDGLSKSLLLKKIMDSLLFVT